MQIKKVFIIRFLFTANILLLICITCTAEDKKKNETKKESPITFQVSRYLGFRQASDLTVESDYNFILREDNTWTYQALNGEASLDGKLEMAGLEKVAEWIELAGKVEPIDPLRPRIADAPKLGVQWSVKKEMEKRELQVGSELGKKIHNWVQSVRTADAKVKRIQVELGQVRGGLGDPIIIKSANTLQKVIDDKKAREQILTQVDFESQQLLLFRWSGSGQDNLSIELKEEDKKETAIITYKAGRTRDLRPHNYLFALPQAAEWKVVR